MRRVCGDKVGGDEVFGLVAMVARWAEGGGDAEVKQKSGANTHTHTDVLTHRHTHSSA